MYRITGRLGMLLQLAIYKWLSSVVGAGYHEPAMDDDWRAAAIQCDRALTSVFAVLGKRWTGLVIGVLLERPARFAEIARAIPGITESMLSARLTELKAAGLLTREVIEGPPTASLYRLTPSGEALRPALVALGEWAQAHLGTQG
jgi:DNA-binding HxlR family transcriptional regulator